MSTLLQAFDNAPKEKRIRIGNGTHRDVWALPHIAGVVFKTPRGQSQGVVHDHAVANIGEARLWDYLSCEPDWIDHASWLAPVLDFTPDGSIVAMVQVDPIPTIEIKRSDGYKYQMPSISLASNLVPPWMNDSHGANIGMYRGKIVQLDYGLFHRNKLPRATPSHKWASKKELPVPIW